MTGLRFVLAVSLALLAGFSPASGRTPACSWRTGWASAQMVPEGENALPKGALADTTLRQIVRTTIGGPQLRVRLSNQFGTAPLTISAATIATTPDNRAATLGPAGARPLRFDGQASVTIPPGTDWLSDPVEMVIQGQSDLAISLHFPADPPGLTGHPGSRATSWLAPGNQVAAPALRDAKPADRWYHLAAVETLNCAAAPVIVALGDSITDGRGSTTNGNDRWTDILARRLAGRAAVINQGIGGNRLLLDGLGPNALARLDRDVLVQPGVTHLILLEGVNDLGTLTRDAPVGAAEHERLVARMIGAYRQVIARARARGIKVIGATIMPFMGFDYYHPDAANEADRQAVNRWIRESKAFDAVVDFDAVTRDPARPDRLNPAYDSGDHIHLSPAGYRAVGEAIPLDLFK